MPETITCPSCGASIAPVVGSYHTPADDLRAEIDRLRACLAACGLPVDGDVGACLEAMREALDHRAAAATQAAWREIALRDLAGPPVTEPTRCPSFSTFGRFGGER